MPDQTYFFNSSSHVNDWFGYCNYFETAAQQNGLGGSLKAANELYTGLSYLKNNTSYDTIRAMNAYRESKENALGLCAFSIFLGSLIYDSLAKSYGNNKNYPITNYGLKAFRSAIFAGGLVFSADVLFMGTMASSQSLRNFIENNSFTQNPQVALDLAGKFGSALLCHYGLGQAINATYYTAATVKASAKKLLSSVFGSSEQGKVDALKENSKPAVSPVEDEANAYTAEPKQVIHEYHIRRRRQNNQPIKDAKPRASSGPVFGI